MNYLDISSEVTDSQLRDVLDSLLRQFSTWRHNQGWCTELYYHVDRLTPLWHWNTYHMQIELDIPEGITAQQRAQELRDLRGRILQFTVTQPETLTMEKANEFLVTAGLAPYVPEQPASTRYYVSLGAHVSSELPAEEIQRKLQRYVTRLGAERSPSISIDRRDDAPAMLPPLGERTALLPAGRVSQYT